MLSERSTVIFSEAIAGISTDSASVTPENDIGDSIDSVTFDNVVSVWFAAFVSDRGCTTTRSVVTSGTVLEVVKLETAAEFSFTFTAEVSSISVSGGTDAVCGAVND